MYVDGVCERGRGELLGEGYAKGRPRAAHARRPSVWGRVPIQPIPVPSWPYK